MKAYKRPTAEAILTKQIRDVLRAVGYFHFKVLQGLGAHPGVADIIGLTKDGRFFAIEVKAPKGVLSGPQFEFLDNVRRANGIGIVARSIEDVIEGLQLQNRFAEYKHKENP